jgi:hypothetical protein
MIFVKGSDPFEGATICPICLDKLAEEKSCPYCGSLRAKCPECGKQFRHGEASHCDEPDCKKVNAPLDCTGCGRVLSQYLDGVLDFGMEHLAYERRSEL